MNQDWSDWNTIQSEIQGQLFYPTVRDIDRTMQAYSGRYVLITDSQEISAILSNETIENDGWGCLYVRVDAGDYAEIWACEPIVPYLSARVYRLK